MELGRVRKSDIDREMQQAYLEYAMFSGAAFCCLPEYFNVLGIDTKDTASTASNYTYLLDRVCSLALRYHSYVILPMLVPEAEHLRNRAYLVETSGKVVGYYDKVHLTISERNMLGVQAGDEVKVFDTKYGRLGLVICYDIYFPELFASLTRLRPDIIFFPSLQRSEHEPASESMLKTRAMDTQAYLVRSSIGREAGLPWAPSLPFGQSCIVHPDGTILANAGHYEGIAMAHIPLPFNWQRQRCNGYKAQSVREFLNEDSRPVVYGPAKR